MTQQKSIWLICFHQACADIAGPTLGYKGALWGPPRLSSSMGVNGTPPKEFV